MVNYTQMFESGYARNKLKNLEYNEKNLNYLRDLINIESVISVGRDKDAYAKKLKKKHPEEWDEMKAEFEKNHFRKNRSFRISDNYLMNTFPDLFKMRQRLEKKQEELRKLSDKYNNLESIRTWKLMGGIIH